jgi:hypothetical protein
MEITYLTNACGEETGKGATRPTAADLAKVDFEQGPGWILQYLAEIEGKVYVLGNLEIYYRDEFVIDEDLPGEDEAEILANKVVEELKVRALDGARVLPLDEMPGCITVGLAIPLDSLSSRQEANIAFRAAFGPHCGATHYVWHGEIEVCDEADHDIAEAFRLQKDVEANGFNNVYVTDGQDDAMIDPSLVEKYCAPILAKQNHTPKRGCRRLR